MKTSKLPFSCTKERPTKTEKQVTTYIFININLPFICGAVVLEVLKERGASISRRQGRQVQVHKQKVIYFGNKSSDKRDQEGIGFCLLSDRSAQDSFQLAQKVAGLCLVVQYFRLKKGVEFGCSHGTNLERKGEKPSTNALKNRLQEFSSPKAISHIFCLSSVDILVENLVLVFG